MTESAETQHALLEKNRMEALIDGIFAFAMTLLVTSMILPRSALITESSGSALISLLPVFYHYIIAFFVLAAFWISHHAQFSRIHHIDRNMISLTIIALFFVTLVPFTTSFIGDYDADVVSTCLFELNLLILGMVFAIQWIYATRDKLLVSPDYPEHEIRYRTCRALIIPVISLAGILLTLIGLKSSTLIYMGSPVLTYLLQRYFHRTTAG